MEERAKQGAAAISQVREGERALLKRTEGQKGEKLWHKRGERGEGGGREGRSRYGREGSKQRCPP